MRTTARLARGLDAATLTVRLERAAYRLAAHLGELEDRLEQGGVDAWLACQALAVSMEISRSGTLRQYTTLDRPTTADKRAM